MDSYAAHEVPWKRYKVGHVRLMEVMTTCGVAVTMKIGKI